MCEETDINGSDHSSVHLNGQKVTQVVDNAGHRDLRLVVEGMSYMMAHVGKQPTDRVPILVKYIPCEAKFTLNQFEVSVHENCFVKILWAFLWFSVTRRSQDRPTDCYCERILSKFEQF